VTGMTSEEIEKLTVAVFISGTPKRDVE